MKTFRLFLAALLLSTAFLTASPATPAHGAATYYVTDCSASAGAPGRLVNVMTNDASSGDTIEFSCSGIIPLSTSISITKDIRIDGAGQSVTLSGGNTYRVIYNGTFTVSLSNLTIADGQVCDACYGAGIYNGGNLIITNSVISGNNAHSGAGIYNDGTLSIVNSTFTANSSIVRGGAIHNTADLAVLNSTVNGNTAGNSGGGIFTIAGGTNPVYIVNSTITNNLAADGGGIFDDGGELNITHSTIAGNTGGSGLYLWDSSGNGPMTVTNSLIANNTGGNCIKDGGVTFTMNTYNLAGDTSCDAASKKTPAELNLGPLADNGGPTQTMALLPGSHAIDSADSVTCTATTGDPSYGAGSLDQRGVTRPQSAQCDVGAYEAVIQTIISIASQDGWILESSETSGKGGTMNNGGKTFRLGDDASNKQYRSILSFDTSSLGVDAQISSVTLIIKKKGVKGTNPFNTHGNLKLDIRKGDFGGNSSLALGDFKAKPSKKNAANLPNTPNGKWYSVTLNPSLFQYINLTGGTQFRLRFAIDDNNDFGADFINFLSGNAGASNRPQLIVEYMP